MEVRCVQSESLPPSVDLSEAEIAFHGHLFAIDYVTAQAEQPCSKSMASLVNVPRNKYPELSMRLDVIDDALQM